MKWPVVGDLVQTEEDERLEERHGALYQKSVDNGREDVTCGICEGEVKEGFTPDEDFEGSDANDDGTATLPGRNGICMTCADRVAAFVKEWQQIRASRTPPAPHRSP